MRENRAKDYELPDLRDDRNHYGRNDKPGLVMVLIPAGRPGYFYVACEQADLNDSCSYSYPSYSKNSICLSDPGVLARVLDDCGFTPPWYWQEWPHYPGQVPEWAVPLMIEGNSG